MSVEVRDRLGVQSKEREREREACDSNLPCAHARPVYLEFHRLLDARRLPFPFDKVDFQREASTGS